MSDHLDGITWFRGSSVRIRRMGTEIHVDPIAVDEDSKADFVLLTHPHYDNFSEDDIARVRGPNTVLIAPASMKKQLDDADHFMRPGDMLQIDGLDVLAIRSSTPRRMDGWGTSSRSGTRRTTTREIRIFFRPCTEFGATSRFCLWAGTTR